MKTLRQILEINYGPDDSLGGKEHPHGFYTYNSNKKSYQRHKDSTHALDHMSANHQHKFDKEAKVNENIISEISKEALLRYRDKADSNWGYQADKVAIANDKIKAHHFNRFARNRAMTDRSIALDKQKRRDRGMALADKKLDENKGKGFSQDTLDAIERMANDQRTHPAIRKIAQAKLGSRSAEPSPESVMLAPDKETLPHHDVLLKHGFRHIGSSGRGHSYHKNSRGTVNLISDKGNVEWRHTSADRTSVGKGHSSESLDNHLKDKFL